jgi:AraC family transcriptional regulator
MEHRITSFPSKRLVGKRLLMTFSDNRTPDIWRSFMPRLKEISNSIGTDLYSVQFYSYHFFDIFDADREFEKWAAIEVTDFDTIPDGLESLVLPGGLYAVFEYKGAPGAAADTFRYILSIWLPESSYTLDDRPHFEILGDKFKMGDPDSEEEIWIPVKPKILTA